MNQSSNPSPGQYRCPWCGAAADTTLTSCPSCGSPVNVKQVESHGGWYELPAIRDMAKLQFGQSVCQIEGTYVPVADVNLAGSDSVYFTHHVLLWRDPNVQIATMPLAGAWKRMFAGMPLIMTEAHGPGHIAFSMDHAGETIALPLHPGQSVDVREGVFMLATSQVEYSWFSTDFWYRTESETQYPVGQYMDRFHSGSQPGLVLLHGSGNVFVRRLQPGQSILVKPTSLVYKDTTVNMTLYIEHPHGYNRVWSRRYVWLRLNGPGRVCIQSAMKHWEDPPEPVQNSSYGTNIVDW